MYLLHYLLRQLKATPSLQFIKTWQKQLKYPSYDNLKRFGNAKGIDMFMFKIEKNLFFCQICI